MVANSFPCRLGRWAALVLCLALLPALSRAQLFQRPPAPLRGPPIEQRPAPTVIGFSSTDPNTGKTITFNFPVPKPVAEMPGQNQLGMLNNGFLLPGTIDNTPWGVYQIGSFGGGSSTSGGIGGFGGGGIGGFGGGGIGGFGGGGIGGIGGIGGFGGGGLGGIGGGGFGGAGGGAFGLGGGGFAVRQFNNAQQVGAGFGGGGFYPGFSNNFNSLFPQSNGFTGFGGGFGGVVGGY
jgi:hypothetical protein